MPRLANTKNASYFHYRVDTMVGENVKCSKYHYTIKEMCEEYNTTNCCLWKMLSKPGHKPRAEHLKNLKFNRVKQPTRIYVEHPADVAY